jgi:hypothetical protein
MRLITISLCVVALTAAPAFAKEGNPVSGVGVSVENSPGGIKVNYANANDAKAACVAARGTFTNTGGKMVCANPGPLYEGRKGRGIAVSRAGGAFEPVQQAPTTTPPR